MMSNNCFDIWDSIKPTSIKDDYEQDACDALKDGFNFNPYHEDVNKNFNLTETFDVWITNGNKKDKSVGYKRIVSYPYDTIQFEIGDYINWIYGGVDTDWLIETLDIHKKYDVNGRLFKCNNMLKWIDEDGVIQSYPCVIMDNISNDGTDENRTIVTFTGDVDVWIQLNSDTEKIELNKRFLFSNSNSTSALQTYAYELTNNNNFTDGSILKLSMSMDQINEFTDDLVNKIADRYENIYTIEINEDDFEQAVSYTSTLSAIVKLNGEIESEPVSWSSDNVSVGTISSSGVINLLSTGTVNFTAKMTNNNDVSDSIQVDVVASPSGTIDVRITPNISELTEGSNQVFVVNKYVDDVVAVDTFSITASGVPTDNYTLTAVNLSSTNTFTLTNIEKYVLDNLVITCTSNVDASVGNISILLKGLW